MSRIENNSLRQDAKEGLLLFSHVKITIDVDIDVHIKCDGFPEISFHLNLINYEQGGRWFLVPGQGPRLLYIFFALK